MIGAVSGCLCRRNRTPPAMHPGGKYELEKVSMRTRRPVASSSALVRASRVNGQCVASTMTPVAITPRSTTPLIQSHFGKGRGAAGGDCSISTWNYEQFRCRGPGETFSFSPVSRRQSCALVRDHGPARALLSRAVYSWDLAAAGRARTGAERPSLTWSATTV
jgi:hypothetical protein